MKSHNRVPKLTSPTGSTLEVLESRIAPATLSAPGTFTYTDGDGDIVKVNVAGKFTSVDFLNGLGEDVVASGGDVASVVVSGAGKDFAIIVVADDVIGDGVVTLGNIAGANGERLPIIKGVFTVQPADDTVTYELAGFRGTGFSIDGGLSIFGSLTGAAANGAGLDVTNVPLGSSILISQGIEVGATAAISKALAGKINIGGEVAGSLTVGTVSGQLLVAEVPGTVIIQSGLTGRILTGDVTGLVELQGKIGVNARISSSADLNLKSTGDLSGSVHVVGDLALDVGANLSVGEVLVGGELILDVGGSVLKSRISAQDFFSSNTGVRNDIIQSSIVGGTGVTLAVGRSIKGSRLSSGLDDMAITIGGNLQQSELQSGDDMEVDIAGSMLTSRVLPDGQLVQSSVQRDVIKSVLGSQSSSAEITVGGRMMASQLIAGTDASLSVTGDLVALDAIVGANASVVVGGNLTGSKFSVGEVLDVQVAGSLINSVLLPSNILSVEVVKDIQKSTLGSFDNITSVTVGGTLKSSRVDSGESVFVTAGTLGFGAQLRAAADVTVNATTKVDGSIIANGDVVVNTTGVFTASISAAQNVSITADSVNINSKTGGLVRDSKGLAGLPSGKGVGYFRGVRAGGDMEIDVLQGFKAPIVIAGGDVTKFHVGSDFSALLSVAGDFVPGEITGSNTVIGGITSKTTVIDIGGNVGSDTSSPRLIFGGAFLGRLSVDGKLVTDLEFSANVNRLTFNGGVGPALLGDNIVDIIVNGTLSSLHSASLFQRTDAMSGKFVDGEGTITGLLAATVAALNVTPDDFTV